MYPTFLAAIVSLAVLALSAGCQPTCPCERDTSATPKEYSPGQYSIDELLPHRVTVYYSFEGGPLNGHCRIGDLRCESPPTSVGQIESRLPYMVGDYVRREGSLIGGSILSVRMVHTRVRQRPTGAIGSDKNAAEPP